MDNITDYFIHPTIVAEKGRPNRESMHNLQTKMHQNAMSIPCELGGSMHGYLGVAMSNTEYASKFRTSFAPHIHLGPLPAHPLNPAQYQIAVEKDMYARAIKLINKQIKVIQALRNLIINHYSF